MYTLTVAVGGSGTITSDVGGIDCSDAGGTCSADFVEGTTVTLSKSPASGWAFTEWSGDCSGTSACSVNMSQSRSVVGSFDGPFDYSATDTLPSDRISLIPGESRSFAVAVNVTKGASLSVMLSTSGLPTGVTSSFDHTTVMPDATANVTLTAAANAPVGSGDASVDGSQGQSMHSLPFSVYVASPNDLSSPAGLAIESGGATALLTHVASTGNYVLVRVDATTKRIVKTIAEYDRALHGIAIESGGTSALVASDDGLLRVTLATGAIASITSSFQGGQSVAIESGGTTALVTDCGPSNNCGSGRLDRVTLATGAVTTLNPTVGLNGPRGVVIEPSGTTALVAENAANRLVRILLSSGSVLAIATGFTSPDEVAVLPGGTSVLLADQQALFHVEVATGVATPIGAPSDYGGTHAVALESGGSSALVAHTTYGPGSYGATGYGSRLTRVDLRYPVRSLAPARQSVQPLYTTRGVALEASGTSALVVDCGAASCQPSGWRVVRVDLAAGTVGVISSSLQSARGIAIESSGTSALVVEGDANMLVRVDLSSGQVTTIATGIANMWDVIPEANGTTALVTTSAWPNPDKLLRVTLSNGSTATVGSYANAFLRGAIALESGGTSVLVTTAAPDGIARINLSDGMATQLSTGLSQPSSVAVEAGGATALVVNHSTSWHQLVRVDLATGNFTVVAPTLKYNPNGNQDDAQSVAIEGSGSALVTQGNRLLRVTNGPIMPVSAARGLVNPTGFVLTSSAALTLDCGGTGANCSASGRVLSVNLSSQAITPIVATGLNQPSSIALEQGGTTALITECGPSNQTCSSAGRVLRVTLSNGNLGQIATGLNSPDGIAIEAGGTTALVCEKGASRLLRVDLGSGSFDIIASNLWNVRGVVIEPGGATALVASDDWGTGGLRRVDLSSGAVSTVLGTWSSLDRFVLSPSGTSALVAWAFPGGLGKVDLTTGSLDMLAVPLFEYPNALVTDSAGANIYFSDTNSGTLFRIAAP